MRRAWMVVLATCGCNQVFGLEPTTSLHADAEIDAIGCSGVRFVGPTSLHGTVIDGAPFERDPSFGNSPDEIWFARQTANQDDDLYVATPTSPQGSFDTVVEAPGLDSSMDDYDLALSADGLDAVFASLRGGSRRAFEATRAVTTASFEPPSAIPELSGTDLYFGIDLSVDGRTLYYVDRDENLWSMHRAQRDQPFDPPAMVAAGVRKPSVSPDERELFFLVAGTNTGIYRRVRADTTRPFDPVDELINADGADPDISPDSKQLVMTIDGSLALLTRTCN